MLVFSLIKSLSDYFFLNLEIKILFGSINRFHTTSLFLLFNGSFFFICSHFTFSHDGILEWYVSKYPRVQWPEHTQEQKPALPLAIWKHHFLKNCLNRYVPQPYSRFNIFSYILMLTQIWGSHRSRYASRRKKIIFWFV